MYQHRHRHRCFMKNKNENRTLNKKVEKQENQVSKKMDTDLEAFGHKPG